MTNPNNAVGTNGAYGGRTSVKALNDVLAWFPNPGIISGWTVSPSSGMTLSVGGVSGTRDAAIAEDNNGNRTTIDNISEAPISVTLPAAPASNSRIDSIVAYVNNPPEGAATVVDNPSACGLIVVSSDVSSSPTAPSDTAIRSAITADGASGSTAFYAVLATVTIGAGTTTVTNDMISAGQGVTVGSDKIDFATYSLQEKVVGRWIDGRLIYRITVPCGTLPNATTKDTSVGLSNVDIAWVDPSGSFAIGPDQIITLPFSASNPYPAEVSYLKESDTIRIVTNVDRSNFQTSFVTLLYIKTS